MVSETSCIKATGFFKLKVFIEDNCFLIIRKEIKLEWEAIIPVFCGIMRFQF